jgi:hypothetical protein
MSLSNVGLVLSEFQRNEETLAEMQESVDIYRRLAQTQRDAFLPGIATNLNNLARTLVSLSRSRTIRTCRPNVPRRRKLPGWAR